MNERSVQPPAALTGRVALVTGAGRQVGLGAGIARSMAGAGAAVAVGDLAPCVPRAIGYCHGDGAAAVCSTIVATGADAIAVYGDVTDEDQARAMVAATVKAFGRLDILVNNAAAPQGLDRADIADVPIDAFDEQWMVNVRGAFLMMQAVTAVMREQRYGRIVNISSQVARIGMPHRAAYAASKAGLLGLTRAAACDVAADGITVNAICPGAVATPRLVHEAPTGTSGAEAGGRAIPVGRLGDPDDIGSTCVFLASEGASYVTGQTISVDGGLYAL